MFDICVFAGTTEGRKLVEFLSGQPVSVTACVATEYGQTLLQPAENLTISAKRLTAEEMEQLFAEKRFDLVIDATHPYAQAVTQNIIAACKHTGVLYLRLSRGSLAAENAVYVENIDEAVEFLNTQDGKILLTTGSKELEKYVGLTNFAERVYARVLPMEASLKACGEVGLKPANIIAMQGPFSERMNVTLMQEIGAKFLVTKDSGSVGGFAEKATAAEKCGATLVVIGRPPQQRGTGLGEMCRILCEEFDCEHHPKVSIVGIGMGNAATQTLQAHQAIEQADCLIGAKRMLESVGVKKPSYDAILPEKIAKIIDEHPEYRRFAVLMSGDVGFFSGTKKLLPLLSFCNVEVLPGISSMVYLCAKRGISYETVKAVSLHGREGNIVADVRANSLVFALVGGDDGVNRLCQSLCDADLGHLSVTVGQRLSYEDEKICTKPAETLVNEPFDSLSAVLIENPSPDAIVTHGLPDEAFLRTESVPMTKSEVRSVVLSKLQLTNHAIGWDVGAGTGSVSIEMAMQAKCGRIFAIERKEAAVELLSENKNRFQLTNLDIVSGVAPEACGDLPTPTHVFIGGSTGNMHEIITLILSKNPNARIVATAIAMETVSEILQCMQEFAFEQTEIVHLQASKDKCLGHYHLMNANNPIYIFTMQGGKMA